MLNKKEDSILSVILYGIPILLFLILTIVYGFNGLFGQDSHAYYQYAKELNIFFETGEEPGYFYWPKLYPFLGALLGSIGIPILLGMRMISLFSMLGVIYYSNKLIREIYNKDGKLWLLISLVVSTYFIRGGLLVMSDMLATFLVVYCYWIFVRYMKTHKVYFIIIMGVVACIALFVRYPTLPILFAPIFLAVFSRLKKLKYWWLITTIVLAGGISLLFIYVHLFEKILLEFFERWSFKHIFSRKFDDSNGHIEQWVPNIMYIFGNFFHIGYLAVGALLIPFYNKIIGLRLVFLMGIGCYLFFLSGFSTQSYRFLMLSHPLVIIILFPMFLKLWNWLKQYKIHNVFVVGTILFNCVFFIYSFSKTYRVHLNEKEIAEAIKSINSQKPIYSFYVDQSFPSYDIQNEIRNLYMMDYQTFEKGSLVVFNVSQFDGQWEGTNVMNNWEKLSEKYELEEVVEFKNNWKIYRIK